MKEHFIKKKMLLIITISITLLGCSNDDTNSNYQGQFLPQIDASSLPSENRPFTMFEDNENPSLMYDKNDRWFRMNEIVQMIQLNNNKAQLSLYSPQPLNDVKIYAKIPNYNKRFVLFHFSHIPAFHRSVHTIPLVEGTFDYELENGNAVTIEKIDGLSNGNIEFSVESSDPFFQKLKKIKSKHLIQFHDGYHINEPGKFLKMNPVLAKEAIVLMTNFSYALSHPIYYKTFLNFDRYKIEQGHTGAIDWHGNDADNNGNYDYFSKSQIENIYWDWLDSRTVYLAMVGGAAALGSGPLVSSWESTYVSSHWVGGVSVWSHEFGHHIGYGHSSNFANSGEGGGQQEMISRFMEYLMHIKDLPYTDPEILKTWTKTQYINGNYSKPILRINQNNPFLLKYRETGTWN